MALSRLVREARLRAHLSQAELALRAGVAKSTVGRIETGTRSPTADLVDRLVRAAGFEIDAQLIASDPDQDSLFERTLARTPAQRLADATRAARFVLRGRRALRSARG
jgi:transcriptional regulator with XRE-family HTH domain